jgi:glycosyltransferase involved in cell wall biosynthesis
MNLAVVIPCHNAASFISEGIHGVLAQQLPAAEIVAVDDGSADNTRDELAKFGSRVLVVGQQNRGPAAARNTGARAATAEWLAFLDADDVFLPDALAAYQRLHQAFPEAKVLFGDFQEFDSAGRQWPPSASQVLTDIDAVADDKRGDCYLLKPPAEILISRNGAFTPSGMVLQRQLLLETGLFDESNELRGAEDLDLYFKVMPTEAVAFINRVVVRKRRHGQNLSAGGHRMRTAAEYALRAAETRYRASHPDLLPVVRRKYTGLLAGWARADVAARRQGAVATTMALVGRTPFDPRAWWLLARAMASPRAASPRG